MDAQDRQSHTKAMHARPAERGDHRSAGWLEGGPVGYPSLCNALRAHWGVPSPPAYFDVERRSMSLRTGRACWCTAIM
jgi:hypothetical protein